MYTLGRKAFEAFWLDRAKHNVMGDEWLWLKCPQGIALAWEAAAEAVRSFTVAELTRAGNPHSAATKRTQRARQGGMVNVHTKPPTHYNAHPSGVECIEVTRHLPFNLGNVVKYIWRAGLKENESEIKDLEKSLDYLNDEINKRKLALGVDVPRALDAWNSYVSSELVHQARIKRTTPAYGPDGKGHQ